MTMCYQNLKILTQKHPQMSADKKAFFMEKESLMRFYISKDGNVTKASNMHMQWIDWSVEFNPE